VTDQHSAADCPHGELAVAWAFRALEPAEETVVAAHLPDCAACTRIVAETEEIGAILGASVPDAEPSAELEQRVLALVDTAQTTRAVAASPPAAPREDPAPAVPPESFGRSEPAGPPVPAVAAWQRKPPRRRRRRDPICLPEAMLTALVVLVVCAIAVAVVFYLV
jgi:hypothetical protein